MPSSEGQFTVLIGHAPVMATLRPGVLEISLGGKDERIFVRGGFADVNADGLTVLAEEAIPMADLNVEQLSQSIKDAEEDVADAKDATTKAEAELKLLHLKEVQAEIGR